MTIRFRPIASGQAEIFDADTNSVLETVRLPELYARLRCEQERQS